MGAKTVEETSESERTRERICVLIIDDDEDGRDLMAEALRAAGYSVCIANHGREAYALLQEVLPSVIFLDINMPVMDGARFRQVQRQNDDLLGIPTIVMTSAAEIDPILDPAVRRTLRKPFRVSELLAIVAEHCKRASDAGS